VFALLLLCNQYRHLQQEANSRVQLIGRYNDTIAKLKEERELISDKNPYDERIEQITKTIRAYNDNKFSIAATILALKSYIVEIGKVNEKEKEQLGIIGQLQEDIETLGDKIKKAHSVEDIEKYNRQLVVLEARLKDLNELGKNFVNPLASQVFDIKNTFGSKIYLEDLVDTQTLEADTERLFGEIGKKAGESFVLGVANEIDQSTELQKAFEAAKTDLINSGIDIAANSLTTLANMEADSYNDRLRDLSTYYDRQQLLAGDNERAKEQLRLREEKQVDSLRKKQAQKEKQAAIFSIIISTAAAIAKTAATLGYPAAIPGIIAAAAEGAAQLAIVSAKNPGFAKGVLNLNGKGTGTSDSINARLSKGESVMTAQEWKHLKTC